MTLDSAGLICDLNQRAAVVFGYSPEELIGRSVESLFTDAGMRTYVRLLETHTYSGQGANIAMHHRVIQAKSSDERLVKVEVSLIAWGSDAGVLLLLRNVTARDQIRENRLKEFLDVLPFPILIFARNRDPEFVNKDAMRRFGISDKREIASASVVPEGASEPAEELESIRRTFETGQVQVETKLEWITPKGRRIPFNLLVRPFEVDEYGQVRRVIVVVSDMSDLKQRQRENQRRIEAEAASRAKSKFLANISHEIRTPLNAMLGFQQLVLQKEELAPMDRKNIEMSLQSGVGLLDLLNNIIDIARIDSGAVEVDEQDFEVEILRKTIEDMFADRARAAGLKFSVRVLDNCPELVRSDVDKLQTILGHLVANALKFTAEGEVRVVIARQGDKLLLEVADTGPGIDRTRLERLFEPFQPLDHENEAAEGSGLGLAICKSFVDALEGTIELETEARQGACFKIQIPVANFEEDTVEETTAIRVLVVDDSESNRQLLQQLLSRVGYEFFEAADGVEGIEVAVACKPHVVLMDLQMPRMDGYQAAREIKARMDTRVIAVSANVFDGDIKRAEEAGIDGFVKKPFRLGMILDVIEKNFEEENAQASEADDSPEVVLDALSAEQRSELRDSLMRADPLEFKRLLNDYGTVDRNTASALSRLVEGYRYQEVIDLLGR